MSDSNTDTLDPSQAEAFRQSCVEFLEANATGLPAYDSAARGAASMAATRAFQKKAVEAGLAGLTYDKAYGGAGLTKAHTTIWRDVYAGFPDIKL